MNTRSCAGASRTITPKKPFVSVKWLSLALHQIDGKWATPMAVGKSTRLCRAQFSYHEERHLVELSEGQVQSTEDSSVSHPLTPSHVWALWTNKILQQARQSVTVLRSQLGPYGVYFPLSVSSVIHTDGNPRHATSLSPWPTPRCFPCILEQCHSSPCRLCPQRLAAQIYLWSTQRKSLKMCFFFDTFSEESKNTFKLKLSWKHENHLVFTLWQ